MALKKLKPTTPGQRFKLVTNFDEITTATPEKSLVTFIKKSGGRNNTGKMTMRYIGGGHKKMYRIIDFKRDKDSVPAVVKSVEYDPNRTGRIALLQYIDGEKRYILAPHGLQVGQKIMSGKGANPDVGNCLFLSEIPLGTLVHNIEMRPNEGAKIARSAGTYAQLMSRDGKYATLKMPSGETRLILVACKATIGVVSNLDHQHEISGKAGRSRWMGVRPRVRGSSMNPVDHPMGGGEGRSSGGQSRSRNGIPSKGYKTRAPKNSSSKLIISKRK